ncbi:MAG: putative DnaJ domain protein [Streblomastix strix]|uniref:Putative DnaJ domain protein n=1 Tax=Streblomastix strix TaxID=222440 RepID=A0A5J4VC21_9EUKA|nr:MAG: putative DnaJ domain protein [Streblomastix strix]
MSTALKSQFADMNFFKALGVEKSASQEQIKKAYYKLALKFHPDKNPTNLEQATVDFQCLSKIYEVLSNQEARVVYERTGRVTKTDIDDLPANEQLSIILERFQAQKPTNEDITETLNSMKANEEELKDLETYYNRYKGDMKKIIQCVPGCERSDIPRLRNIIEKWINDGKVKPYPAFNGDQLNKTSKQGQKTKSSIKPSKKAKIEEKEENNSNGEDINQEEGDDDEEEEEDLSGFIVDDEDEEIKTNEKKKRKRNSQSEQSGSKSKSNIGIKCKQGKEIKLNRKKARK